MYTAACRISSLLEPLPCFLVSEITLTSLPTKAACDMDGILTSSNRHNMQSPTFDQMVLSQALQGALQAGVLKFALNLVACCPHCSAT